MANDPAVYTANCNGERKQFYRHQIKLNAIEGWRKKINYTSTNAHDEKIRINLRKVCKSTKKKKNK